MFRTRFERGQSLAEMLVVVAVLGFLALIVIPALVMTMRRAALRAGAARIYALMQVTREDAIAMERNRGIRFFAQEQGWMYAVYDDGDGDGVRSDDIVSGVDPLAAGPEPACCIHPMARIGIPPGGAPDPDGGPPLAGGSTPVHFNRSTLCSFSKEGDGTPGTVYLTAGSADMVAVRNSGAGGTIRMLLFRGGKWSRL